MYVYSWFIVLTQSLLTVQLAISEIKPVQSQTDRQTDRQTELSTTVTLSAHARRGLMNDRGTFVLKGQP